MSKNNQHAQSLFDDIVEGLTEAREWARGQRRVPTTIVVDSETIASGSFDLAETMRLLDTADSATKATEMIFIGNRVDLTRTIFERRKVPTLVFAGASRTYLFGEWK